MNNNSKMNKKEFWIRLILYVIFGGIIPFVFLVWRFNLFGKVSSISIGGWGIVAIVFVAIFFARLFKAVRKGLPYSIWTQILDGIIKVLIPLAVAAVVVYLFKDLTMQIFQFLMVVIISEMVAIPINPLPKWIHDNKIEQDNDNTKKLLETLGIIKNEEEKK